MFLETTQIKINQLILLSLFPKQIQLFWFSVNNLIAYNIKYTYLSAFRTLVGMDFQRTPSVHCWTGGNGSSLNAPSVFTDFCVLR